MRCCGAARTSNLAWRGMKIRYFFPYICQVPCAQRSLSSDSFLDLLILGVWLLFQISNFVILVCGLLSHGPSFFIFLSASPLFSDTSAKYLVHDVPSLPNFLNKKVSFHLQGYTEDSKQIEM